LREVVLRRCPDAHLAGRQLREAGCAGGRWPARLMIVSSTVDRFPTTGTHRSSSGLRPPGPKASHWRSWSLRCVATSARTHPTRARA